MVKRLMCMGKQAFLCEMLMTKLSENVRKWEDDGAPNNWGGGQRGGATKTAIKNDIVRLRRELLELYKEVDK